MVLQIEEHFRLVASFIALGVEAAAVIAIAIGATEALYRSLRHLRSRDDAAIAPRAIWVRFATWILLALEFTLGADIIRSAVAPTWEEIGKLAAIAAIRTALNYFLVRDLAESGQLRSEQGAGTER